MEICSIKLRTKSLIYKTIKKYLVRYKVVRPNYLFIHWKTLTGQHLNYYKIQFLEYFTCIIKVLKLFLSEFNSRRLINYGLF